MGGTAFVICILEETRMRWLLVVLFAQLACLSQLRAATVGALLDELFIEQEVPGTVVMFEDDIAKGNFTFSETEMVGLSVAFNNNRHEFRFSEDGSSPLTVDGDEPWHVSFDVRLDATLASPRKSIFFFVDDGQFSNVNLTSNRSPAGATGASDPPGESAMFAGKYNFLRLIGPQDGAEDLNLNPTVGYLTGETVHLEIIHTPSADGGVTPSTVEHIYGDMSGTYTTGPRELRNEGVFADGAEMGFVIQGLAHSGTVTDSYAVTISNFQALIGEQPALAGDYNGDGVVNIGDYVVWRDQLGGAGPGADGTGDDLLGVPDGDVDSFDYQWWKSHFNDSLPAPLEQTLVAVPEPASATWFVSLWALLALVRWGNWGPKH